MNLNKYDPCNLMALLKAANDKLKNPNTIDKERYQKIAIKLQARIDYLLDEIDKPNKQKSNVGLSQKDENVFLDYFNSITGHKHRFMDDKAKRQLIALYGKQTVTYHDVEKAIQSAFVDMTLRETVKHLTPEFITRPAQFSKYLNMKTTVDKKVLSI